MRSFRLSFLLRRRVSARVPKTGPPPLHLVPSIATVGAAATITTPSTTAAENTMAQTRNDGGADKDVELPAVGPSTPTTEVNEHNDDDDDGSVDGYMEGDVDVDVNVDMEVDEEAAMDERAARHTTFSDDVAAGMVTPPARTTPPRPDTPRPAPIAAPPTLNAALAAAGITHDHPVFAATYALCVDRCVNDPIFGATGVFQAPAEPDWIRHANIGTRRVRRTAATLLRHVHPEVIAPRNAYPEATARRNAHHATLTNWLAGPMAVADYPVVSLVRAAVERGNREMAAAAIVGARMAAGLERVVDLQLLANVRQFAAEVGLLNDSTWVHTGEGGGANQVGGGHDGGDGEGGAGGGDDGEWPDADLFEDF